MEKKTIRIILHIVAWLLLLGLPLSLSGKLRMGDGFFLIYYTLMVINGLIFYTNYLFFVPKFFFRKKKYEYILSVLALMICFYLISDISGEHISNLITEGKKERFEILRNEGMRPRTLPSRLSRILTGESQVIGYLSSASFMIFLSLGIKVLERQSEIDKMQEEMERAKLNAELAFLKNQISPHFLFNTLNNIYSLIDKSNEDSKNAVIKLSRLMRYVLNESRQDNRPLGDEIDFMNNYIDLMKLRIGTKTKLNVNFSAEYKNLMIPHMLFVSLIENAFKYGISVQKESFINISFECGEHNIIFKCENGMPDSNNGTVYESSGIGLENLKKRLSLLYPDRHELEINKTQSKFAVTLIILLK